MKKLSLLILTVCLISLTGCTPVKENVNAEPEGTQSQPQLSQYSSGSLSVEFPENYKATEDGDMLVVSSADGKIIIGGFAPSVGHPDAEEKDFPFQMITYTSDPKMESDAIPAALYFADGDTETEQELKAILETVKKLP